MGFGSYALASPRPNASSLPPNAVMSIPSPVDPDSPGMAASPGSFADVESAAGRVDGNEGQVPAKSHNREGELLEPSSLKKRCSRKDRIACWAMSVSQNASPSAMEQDEQLQRRSLSGVLGGRSTVGCSMTWECERSAACGKPALDGSASVIVTAALLGELLAPLRVSDAASAVGRAGQPDAPAEPGDALTRASAYSDAPVGPGRG